MLRSAVTTLLVLSLWMPFAFGEDGSIPRLKCGVDRETVHIGDPIRYTLKVTAPEGVEVEFPEFPDGKVNDFELAETGESEGEEAGEEWRERFYTLLGFKTGTLPLPAPEVSLRYPDGREEKLEGEALEIVVESLLEEGADVAQQDIREIKPPLLLPVNYLPLILLAAGLLIVLLLLYLVFKRYFRRKERVIPPPPPRPPAEIAYEELARIRNDNLPAQGKIKEYFTRVSDVARRYLENRFNLRAPERTTEEFLAEMATTNLLSLPQQELVGDFLEKCDLVKFAKYGPGQEEIEGVYNSAVRLIDETKEEKKVEGGKVA